MIANTFTKGTPCERKTVNITQLPRSDKHAYPSTWHRKLSNHQRSHPLRQCTKERTREKAIIEDDRDQAGRPRSRSTTITNRRCSAHQEFTLRQGSVPILLGHASETDHPRNDLFVSIPSVTSDLKGYPLASRHRIRLWRDLFSDSVEHVGPSHVWSLEVFPRFAEDESSMIAYFLKLNLSTPVLDGVSCFSQGSV